MPTHVSTRRPGCRDPHSGQGALDEIRPFVAAAAWNREEALARVLERVKPLEAEEVELAAAAGRVLATTVASPVDLPAFAASAMDGYALRAGDVPGTLAVTGRVAAGRPVERAVGPGE